MTRRRSLVRSGAVAWNTASSLSKEADRRIGATVTRLLLARIRARATPILSQIRTLRGRGGLKSTLRRSVRWYRLSLVPLLQFLRSLRQLRHLQYLRHRRPAGFLRRRPPTDFKDRSSLDSTTFL